MSRLHPLRIAALLVLLTGLALTLQSIVTAPAIRQQLQRKADNWKQLCALRDGLGRYDASIRTFESLKSTRPVALAEVARNAVSNATPAIRFLETRPAAAGWTLQSAEMSYDDVRLSDFAGLIGQAESARPPWRLMEINITALNQSPGRGRVSAVLEALEKRGSSR